MRVAHVGNYDPDSTNGVNVAIAGLVNHLPHDRFDLEVWHFTSKCTQVEKRPADGFELFDLPRRTRPWSVFGLPRGAQRFLDERARAVDLLHVHSVFIPENLPLADLGVPYVLTPHGGYSPEGLGGRRSMLKKAWLYFYENAFVEQAAALHAVSPGEERHLDRFNSSEKTVVIPNGIDERWLQHKTADPGRAQHWLFLGRLAVDHKGLDLLLKGYARLHHRAPQPLPRLVLAGPDFRSGKAHLQTLSRKLGIADAVRFLGPVFEADKQAAFDQAQLFVHTSRWEGLPFALLEAMALGRPVLVTPETNIAPYVEEYDAGWVVEGRPDAIAEGLFRALHASPQELAHKGVQGRVLVRDCFTWEAVAEHMSTLYEDVLQEEPLRKAALPGNPGWRAFPAKTKEAQNRP